jgi:hypothetical protein
VRIVAKDLEKCKAEVENGLASENLDLKARVARVEAENAEVKSRMLKTEDKLADLEKLIRDRIAQLD